MARSVYSQALRNRTNRLKLAVRKKPYKALIAPGVFLCYRRNAGPGTWSVEAGWLRRFALADDFESANGTMVMTFWQAQKHALKMVRGSEGDSDKPVTVAEALDAYEVDLQARGGGKYNASSVRRNLTPAMLAKPVQLLNEVELANWRNGLVTNAGLKHSSANRIGKPFKAALTLAAKRDRRITNSAAWKNGLKPLKAKGNSNPPRDNYYLTDAVILTIVRECYAESADFGALFDTLAVTGVRESQVLKLQPQDLLDGDTDAPSLMMWCSFKGRDRDPEQRKVPITTRLAKTLRARAIARGAERPLFDKLWNVSIQFRGILKRLGLDNTLTPYVLRHSSIIRSIRNGTPLRITAFLHDTSTAEIERTYGRYLNGAVDDLVRKGLLDDSEPPRIDNVVELTRS
jgi:integrase